MPLRHKLLLALACEILLVGMGQAALNPPARGIIVDIPASPHHVIT